MSLQDLTPPSTPPEAPPTISPSLPKELSSLSYWHRTTRAFHHLNANHSSPVPASAEYAIIGSGISGALTAFSLVEHGVDPSSIVIFEAREAVSGASGRNAGHVRPDAFRGFKAYAAIHGVDQAVKIVANEKLVLERVDAFVKKHGVTCDFKLSTTFDVCLTDQFAEYEAQSMKEFEEAGGDVRHVKIFLGDEAKSRTGIADAISAYEWPAGSSHPAKLAQWMLNSVIEKGVQLWTHCPVTSIVKEEDSSRWKVHTPRGSTSTRNVIHCTNAYAAVLLPQLSNFVTPNKAQAHSVVPSSPFTGENTLQSTMSLRYSLRHFYSLIQRDGDGTLILGVSRSNPDLSDETKAEIVSFDDSAYNKEIADDCIRRFGTLFSDSTKSDRPPRHGEGLDHAWTGIIAMTPDSVPIVGPIDELPGQWICAGFNGHGMARIFTCAPGLAQLIRGGEWADTGLPECFQYSPERLVRASEKGQKVSVW